jgi:hypothetical protein
MQQKKNRQKEPNSKAIETFDKDLVIRHSTLTTSNAMGAAIHN